MKKYIFIVSIMVMIFGCSGERITGQITDVQERGFSIISGREARGFRVSNINSYRKILNNLKDSKKDVEVVVSTKTDFLEGEIEYIKKIKVK